ncbi:MAG: UDP-N-acetylglucosamine 2-epimerase (non-hydrolyzing) [Caldisericia bacterium]|nr:UDP-N-acetylglucosamine 2-epimerase (non-hydrolyzing) [Caldisericia bacterium]
MKKPKLLIVFGTRPEAIKMAPLVRIFKQDSSFITKVVLTAQHREMLDQVMKIFSINGDYDFNIMKDKQTLESITSGVMNRFTEVIQAEKPDMVLVHGDTTTTFATTLSSYYNSIPIAHIEAGLRSGDMKNPFPEEMNRKLTDSICTMHLCPTERAKKNIELENISTKNAYVTGNTVVDSLLWVLDYITKEKPEFLKIDQTKNRQVLMTMHRRESWGIPIENVSKAIRDIVKKHNDVTVVFPMHKNPIVRESVYPYLKNIDRVNLIEPMDYLSFVAEMKKSHIIISDSGGIQEESPTFGKPVLLTRSVTERPEGVECGVVKLVGTEYDNVFSELDKLLSDKEYYSSMSLPDNPFGDGHASERIRDHVRNYFNMTPFDKKWNKFTK